MRVCVAQSVMHGDAKFKPQHPWDSHEVVRMTAAQTDAGLQRGEVLTCPPTLLGPALLLTRPRPSPYPAPLPARRAALARHTLGSEQRRPNACDPLPHQKSFQRLWRRGAARAPLPAPELTRSHTARGAGRSAQRQPSLWA